MPYPLAHLRRGSSAYASALVEARQREMTQRDTDNYFNKMRAVEYESLMLRYSEPSFRGEERIARGDHLAAQRHLELAAVARGYAIPRYQANNLATAPAASRPYYVPSLPLTAPTTMALQQGRMPAQLYPHYMNDSSAPANRMLARQSPPSFNPMARVEAAYPKAVLPFGTFGRIRGMEYPRDAVRTHKLYRYCL